MIVNAYLLYISRNVHNTNMEEQTDKQHPTYKTALNDESQKSTMTYRLGCETAAIIGIPVLLIALILKLAGC